MRLKRLLWLGWLLPQFALLLASAYDDMRELRHELRFHYPRAWGDMGLQPFSLVYFGFTMLGIAAVIGLCGLRWWSRWAYAAFTVGLFAEITPDLLHPPDGMDSFLIVPAVVLATLTMCFVPRFHLFRGLPPDAAL